MNKNTDKEALEYHASGKPGKVDVRSSKKCETEYDLALAYSPGVAAPCKEIARDPSLVNRYTTRGNLVAVITNGTAVLGLGDIGPLAAKPVMEGKGVLFKQFAGIDVFDIELNARTIEEFVAAVQALEPTFGGINLEDIAAPDCFEIERILRERLQIPIFHDDQHGTAIITAAALINACHLTKRDLGQIKVVFNGAGAAAIATAHLLIRMGARKENLMLCDSQGVVYQGRTKGMNPYKAEFAIPTERRTLGEALEGADAFIGLSVANVVTPEMLLAMAENPIVFAMANPDPEIHPHLAKKTRPDVIVATGRSDFANQVNNVLGFPSIFRGALDVQATEINEAMKVAAVKALAALAREDVPDSVSALYGNRSFHFGPDYIIPKPLDPRVLMSVAPAVAQAAMDSGVARKPIADLRLYAERLEALGSLRRGFIRTIINRIKTGALRAGKDVPLLIFPDGQSSRVLKALSTLAKEGICRPLLLGSEEVIAAKIKELDLEELAQVPAFHPTRHPKFKTYVDALWKLRDRKGVMKSEAERLMSDPYVFAAMAVQMGDADGLVSGASQNYADSVKPILQIIGTGRSRVASGLNIVLMQDRMLFFADTTVNINPTAEQVAAIAIHCSKVARYFGVEPRIAMLSYSNFTGRKENPAKMKKAAQIVKQLKPELIVDGEMQADTAVNAEILSRLFPFSPLVSGGANVLIFPNLDSGNIAYKLVQQLGGGEVLGPFLMGVKKPANILQRTCTTTDIVNTIVLTALETQAYFAQGEGPISPPSN